MGRRYFNDIDLLICKDNLPDIRKIFEKYDFLPLSTKRFDHIFSLSLSHQIIPYIKKIADFSIYIDINFDLFWGENRGKKIQRENKTILFCGEKTIDFKKLFEILEHEYNIKSIMLEGGGSLNWSILECGMVDELIIMQLPILIGGSSNISLVDGQGYISLETVKFFKLYSFESRENFLLLKYKKDS